MTRLIAGNAYGLRSPIKTYSEMFYLDVIGAEGKTIDVPNPDFETALYVLYGQVMVNDETIYPNELVLLEDTETTIKFAKNSRVILLGGEKWQHVPYIHWNF
ncbi:pirin-like C-terminal cupin domain-containing protein, partial [Pseudoalteromonas sp. S980]